jgi:hypothetical protein
VDGRDKPGHDGKLKHRRFDWNRTKMMGTLPGMSQK